MPRHPYPAIRFALLVVVGICAWIEIFTWTVTGVAAKSAAAPVYLKPGIQATSNTIVSQPGPDDPDPEATEPEEGMVPPPDRLAQPTLPAEPTQADLGGQVYYMVCMACHGDQGQGLTPEWLEAWGLDKNSCWESKCHASNHPPEGFELPKSIPPVVGPIIPARFRTALDLHDYIYEKMPWQAPSTLSEEEYWQLTAYLVRANGISLGRLELNEKTAASISLVEVPKTETGTVFQGKALFAGGSALLLALILIVLLVKFKKISKFH